MTVSSTSSTSSAAASAVSSSSIDVASVVSQLMVAENKPMDALKSKITTQELIISDLGTVKSKVSALQDAITTFESPSSYGNMNAVSSDTSILQATASNGTAAGNYTIGITNIAKSSKEAVSGFSSATAPVTIDPTNGFEITVGNTSYNSNGTIKVSGVVSTNTVSPLGASPTVGSLSNWINSLGASVKASTVQTTASNQWSFIVEGTQTGAANAVSFTGLNTGTVDPNSVVAAQDAQFTVNGVAFVRANNNINDAASGLTLNLSNPTAVGSTVNIAVSAGADNSEGFIQGIVTAYNDLISQYTTLTANSANSKTPGDFANSPTLLSFVSEIKGRIAQGVAYGAADPVTGKRPTLSLASLGMDLQLDGTIKYNSVTHAAAVASGLNTKLASGINVGYVSDTNNLQKFLNSQAGYNGSITKEISYQATAVLQMQDQQATLQTRLDSIQNNYITEYSNLNALLFQLNSTSTSLASALTALTNMAAGK